VSTPGNQPGPVPAPTGFPFARTVCGCRRCSISCEHLPGALAPSDLPIIAAHLGHADPVAFARESLFASEGATLAMADGRIISLPTLVPRSDPGGACIFYKRGRCTIHAVSPFGCSQIDAHMSDAEFTRRSNASYNALLDDLEAGGAYSRTVAELRAIGQVAPPLATRREGLLAAMRKESLI